MHTIELFKSGDQWVAKFSDPSVREIMGTDTIPTPYRASAAAEVVLASVQRKNPDARIFVRETIDSDPDRPRIYGEMLQLLEETEAHKHAGSGSGAQLDAWLKTGLAKVLVGVPIDGNRFEEAMRNRVGLAYLAGFEAGLEAQAAEGTASEPNDDIPPGFLYCRHPGDDHPVMVHYMEALQPQAYSTDPSAMLSGTSDTEWRALWPIALYYEPSNFIVRYEPTAERARAWMAHFVPHVWADYHAWRDHWEAQHRRTEEEGR